MRALPAILPALALALAACATTGQPAPGDVAILRLQRGYEVARAIATLFAPYLPPDRAARLAALGRAVEQALAAARSATDAAALRRAEAATAAYRHAAGQ